MLGLALGDALGATVEFMTPREIRAQYGQHDRIRGGGWLRLPCGQVTDDTTMAFALAQAWLNTGYPPGALDYAAAFDRWMRSKPVDIGHTVRRGIARYRSSGEACVPCSDEAGNGATMRCTPIGIVLLGAAAEQVDAATLSQAHVTHHNPLTDAATLTVVRMVQAGMLAGQYKQGIRAVMALANTLVSALPVFRFRTRRVENPSAYIVDTLRAVFQAIDVHDNFESALIEVVNRGGDADTTGAITGTIMGAMAGEEALPVRWLQALDAQVYRQCIKYADQLIEKSPIWPLRSIQTDLRLTP